MRTELPKKWCIKTDNMDAEIREWFRKEEPRANFLFMLDYYGVGTDSEVVYQGHKLSGFKLCFSPDNSDTVEITTEEFKRLVLKEELTELPRDGWYIRGSKEFSSSIGDEEDVEGDNDRWGYFKDGDGNWDGYFLDKLSNKTEISLSDYIRLTNKTKQMEKEIIGYKLVKQQFSEAANVLLGCDSSYDGDWIIDSVSDIELLKKFKVLDLWFDPVYKQKEPQITVNGYKGEFFEEYVKFGCAKISKYIFIHLSSINRDFIENNREIESVTIGKGTFSKEQIKEIAEYYQNK